MDNLTHTLIGALAGETAARFMPTARSLLPETARRNLYLTLMIAGSNVPDLDFVYTGITGGKLGYLLHHRGHTHTVIGALLLGLVMYALSIAWLRWRRIPHAPRDRWWLAFIALLAPLLHIAMDAQNEYGVHPFWPFDNSWFYGDAIFIIEPLFWTAAAPLAFVWRERVPRLLIALVQIVAIALAFGSGFVPPALGLALTAFALAMLGIGWRCSARSAVLAGFVASICLVLLFKTAAGIARGRVETLVAAQYPAATALDHVLAPLPVNPLCWEVIAVQVEDDAYSLRQALLSLAPEWVPAHACGGPGAGVQTTVTLTNSTAPDTAEFEWLNEVTMSRGEARTLLQQNCEARALSGFVRALWFRADGNGWLMGDLRYDREPGLGFAEMQVSAEPAQCPRFVPPWEPPRADLL
ncbi:MAG: metal-dependent hydrolase [Gammaproteobacteria bacterium]